MGQIAQFAERMWPGGCGADLVRGVRAPLRQPALAQGLDSWYLQPGIMDMGLGGFNKDLFDMAFAYLQSLAFDDRYDRANGANGPLVPHSDTSHPRPYRMEFGLCHGEGGVDTHGEPVSWIVSYNASFVPPHLWSKRHTPPAVYLFVAHVCTLLRPHVPQLQLTDRYPNSLTVHWYPSSATPGNTRGDTQVGFHTDSASSNGRRVAQRDGTPVLSLSWGETMWFWARSRTDEWVVTALEHGSVWVWSSDDDKSGVRHAVRYPPAECAAGRGAMSGTGRWVIVARWLDMVRRHRQRPPYRNCSGRDCMWLEDEG